MVIKIFVAVIFILITRLAAFCQPTWAPTTAPLEWDRYDDTHFLNADTGWAITLYVDGYQYGGIIKTTDGGATWETLMDSSHREFRDVAFLDAENGFIGCLSPAEVIGDTFFMYQTHDGGFTWSGVNLPGPKQAGICGMRVINDSTLYAVGRYYGPTGFYKTTNSGASWTYTNMSAYECGLVDIFFFNADTGFVCGQVCDSGVIFDHGSATILETTDGGVTWERKAHTDRLHEWCWKMSFPSRNIGYASIEADRTELPDSQFCLKTINGGETWNSLFVCEQPDNLNAYDGLDIEGIGFINDSTGWIGGRNHEPGLNPIFTYKTTDGGQTWNPDYWGENINRFRFMNDTLAYFSGKTIYKYSSTHVPLAISELAQSQITLYPDPVNSELSIQGITPDEVKIYSLASQLLYSINHPAGNKISVTNFTAGIYIMQIKAKGKVVNIEWERQD